MNREIKFRAFRDGFMYDGLSLEKMLSIASKTGFGEGAKTKVEWMQFTGLKDKNGVEIYEAMEIDGIYVVGFKDGSYVLIDISSGDIVLLHDYIKCRGGDVRVTREYAKI